MENTEEIQEQIRLYGHIEWRSKKNLDTFLLQNTFQNLRIVGYATAKTLQKWGETQYEKDPVYIAAKNTRFYYLLGLGKKQNPTVYRTNSIEPSVCMDRYTMEMHNQHLGMVTNNNNFLKPNYVYGRIH